MKHSIVLLAALTLGASACAAPVAQSSSSSAISQSKAEATLVSPNATAHVGQHRIEIAGGDIRVDGVFYGKAPAGSKVRFTVTNGQTLLTVDGQERLPAR